MEFPRTMRLLPNWKSAALAVISAILLILAFPDFGYWPLGFFGLIPLFWSIERERSSTLRSFAIGWLFGLIFFTGTCWWLTFAPITYAGFPTWLAYFLLLVVTALVGIFPGIFAAVMSTLSRRLGWIAILAAPFIWVFTEFLRYWLTGNNWNSIGYSQFANEPIAGLASRGGVYLSDFVIVFINVFYSLLLYGIGLAYGRGIRQFLTNVLRIRNNKPATFIEPDHLLNEALGRKIIIGWIAIQLAGVALSFLETPTKPLSGDVPAEARATVVAIQPNVPMSGLTDDKWKQLRQRHVQLAESALATINEPRATSTTVIFPESPMNFMWQEDMEFQKFIRAFAAKNNVQVLFNSAEPDGNEHNYFNSAVLVGTDGRELAQYDKIYLLPFGESVPAPLQAIVPAFVGSFSYGKEYDLLPLGDVKAGVMICFESHFGELGREYVKNGADVIIEMTNDGYLGPTPVLKQHLANAVFRAVETNRPVLRVTNVGITAYINERGEVSDTAGSYTEATRVWSVAKSDGSQTFYVRYGDWFAWLCTIVTIAILGWAIVRGRTSQ